MKKTFLVLFLMVSIGVACCTEGFVMSAFAAEKVVYEQNFDQVSVGTLPSEVTPDIAATFTEDGFMHVIEKKAGGTDRALRINHQTSAKGTNTATITLPTPINGGFKLEADLKFGSTVKREFTVCTPNGSEMFRVGSDTSKVRLYSRVASVTKNLTDIDFNLDNKVEYHFTFDMNPLKQSVFLTVEGGGYHKSTVIDVSGAGITNDNMGIGSMKLSTYYKAAVGSTGRFFQIDNIKVRTKAYVVTFDGDQKDTEPSGNTAINVNVSLLNNEESIRPMLFFVLYDDEGKVNNVTTEEYPADALEGSEGYTKNFTFDQPVPANYRLRVFVWDNMTGLGPIGDAAEF